MTKSSPSHDIDVLKKELLGMFGHIQRFRKELATIRHPGTDQQDHFDKMADQLDAVVEATEAATDSIMTAMEEIEALVGQVRSRVKDPEALTALDAIGDKTAAVFEACSFQDLTGQRVTKVVESMKFVEERVNALIRIWGRDELSKVVVEINDAKDAERRMLHGPQRKGKGVSQDEVDKMFAEPEMALNQDDIDKLFG